ncbi:MAG TPA: hypothetical protein VFO46_22970 [Candidatus Sulfotelmatobacter sp.]|nr:hypothetical protein [Candidatus Sulfotelmatobacter sp.]
MALLVRRSILIKFSVVRYCVFLLVVCAITAPALAQHTGRTAGASAPVPAPILHPPVYRAPVYQAPVYHAPIYQTPMNRAPVYAPIYVPRISSLSPVDPLGTIAFRPPLRPIRPAPPIIQIYVFPLVAGPFWPSYFCWWATCDQFWASAFLYSAVPVSSWNPANYLPPAPEPVYVYGAEPRELPQLFLNDGTVLNVSDYWLVDRQLHFMISEEEGAKPTEEVIAFDELDLQRTVDVNTRRGFRFMLRNEPFEQYVRDHPEGPPPAISPQ